MSELFGAGGYIEQNTNVPYQPLAGDLGLSDGVVVPTEANAGGIQTEEGFTMDYILGTDAGASGSNFAAERKYDEPMRPDKLRTKIKGKKNPDSYWRTKDNSGKLWGRKQKFEIGPEFADDLSDEDLIDDAVEAMDNPESVHAASQPDPKGRTMEQGNASARFNEMMEANRSKLQREAAARVFADKFEDQPVHTVSDESFKQMYSDLDELTEMPESMLDKVSKYYRRMVNHISRKLTNKSYMSADTARFEMKNMGSNDLHQALLNSYEEHADAPMLGGGDDDEKLAEVPEPEDTPGEFQFDDPDDNRLFQELTDLMADDPEDVPIRPAEAGGGDVEMQELGEAVRRGASRMSPGEFAQDFAEDVQFVQAPGGEWTMASTATSAAKIVGKLAAMGGLTVAGAVATNYLNDLVPNLGDTVNWVGAVAMMSAGDPIAMLINSAVQVFNTFAVSRQKTMEMDDPTAKYGTKVGRVRVGDKWMPAILEASEGDSGLFAQGNKMRMLYGSELVWVPDGRGGFRPEMQGETGSREFIVDDDVFGKTTAMRAAGTDGTGKAYNDRFNPMRDWYFYGDDDAAAYLNGSKVFQPEDDVPYDNYYMRQMNDWRLAMHQMSQSTAAGGAYDPEEFDGLNREFSRIFTEHRNTMPALFGDVAGSAVVSDDQQASYFGPLTQAQSQEDYEKLLAQDSGWWTSSDHGDFGTVNPFYEMMYDSPPSTTSTRPSTRPPRSRATRRTTRTSRSGATRTPAPGTRRTSGG